jgi:solute carrier family 25 phosphate transporter 3
MGAYRGALHAAQSIVAEQGFRGLSVGLTPTFVGYSIQGAFKFSLNEYFKKIAERSLSPQTNQSM